MSVEPCKGNGIVVNVDLVNSSSGFLSRTLEYLELGSSIRDSTDQDDSVQMM